MEIKRYYPDEKGRVYIDGLILKVRESAKYKNYKFALRDKTRVKSITVLGIILFVTGLFFLLGSVGHVELMSLKEIDDNWTLGTYILIDSIGSIFLIVGMIVVRWGYSKEVIYDRWIEEYLGKNTTAEEDVEE